MKARACVKCAADISGRHGNSRYCAPCAGDALRMSWAGSRLVNAAIRRGELQAPATLACVDCGRSAEVYDHRDYSRPLAVAAVCESCNRRRGPAQWAKQRFTEAAA